MFTLVSQMLLVAAKARQREGVSAENCCEYESKLSEGLRSVRDICAD